jgi:hypothetical protein
MPREVLGKCDEVAWHLCPPIGCERWVDWGGGMKVCIG